MAGYGVKKPPKKPHLLRVLESSKESAHNPIRGCSQTQDEIDAIMMPSFLDSKFEIHILEPVGLTVRPPTLPPWGAGPLLHQTFPVWSREPVHPRTVLSRFHDNTVRSARMITYICCVCEMDTKMDIFPWSLPGRGKGTGKFYGFTVLP